MDETSSSGNDGRRVRDVASSPRSGLLEQRFVRSHRGDLFDPLARIIYAARNAGLSPAFPFSAGGAMMSVCP